MKKRMSAAFLALCLVCSLLLGSVSSFADEAESKAAETEAAAEVAAEAAAAGQYKDGVYSATTIGADMAGSGDLTATVTIENGVIKSVEIVAPRDNASLGMMAIAALPSKIVEANGTEGVDVTMGASLTSDAIFRAVNMCLEEAKVEAAPETEEATEEAGSEAETEEATEEAGTEAETEEATEAEPTKEAETEGAEEPGTEVETMITLPADLMPGTEINGFEVVEVKDFPLIGGVAVYFEHQRTGAKVIYIANDDTNRVFDLTFLTRSIDNTGLPHVFEHATLDGSEKYPSKTLFFNLIYQSYQTYMNASTYDCMTTFPVASLSEAQLLKLADYYTDSCLNPMIMEDESIFREEAWRYRMASADAPLTIEGTVYSEMLGANTLPTQAYHNYTKVTFPGSYLGFVSGGDTAYIPDMTWDSLKSYHDLFYHPSNCVGYLYGEIEDYPAFLQLLDDAFAPFEKREFVFEDADYEPITAPVVEELAYPVEAGSDTNHTASIYYSYVCRDVEDEEILQLDTLTDLLLEEASPLKQALKKALPYASFSCFIEMAGPEPAIVFAVDNVNREDAEVFKNTVDTILAQVAENGFDQAMVDSVMAGLAMSTRLTREASDVGVESIIPNMAYNYACTGNIWQYLDYVDALNQMDVWNAEGRYANVVGKYLAGSELTALTVTYPEPGLKEQLAAAETERLAQVKAAMSEDEIAAIVASSNAADEPEDSSALVAQLQAVTVASLPEEIKEYELTDEMGEDGVRRINVIAGVEGVGQVDLYFDAASLPQEGIHLFKLYTDLLGYLDTRDYTREEIDNLASRYLYGYGAEIALTGHVYDYHPYLHTGWISTDEDLATGYELIGSLLYNLKLEDTDRLAEAVSAIKANLKSAITSNSYAVMLYRSYSHYWPMYQYMSYANYLEYYQFLNDFEALLAADPESAVATLQVIQSFFYNREGAIAVFSGSEESIENNKAIADEFFGAMPQEEIPAVEYDLPQAELSEALVIESNVQFNGLVANYEAMGEEGFTADMDAVIALVSDMYLLPMLRDQYGAYSVFHSAGLESGVYIITYRDPNVEETFEVFNNLPEFVENLEVDQETLNGYILSSYVYYAQSNGELSGAVAAAKAAIDGKAQDRYLTYMEQLKSVTPEKVKEYASMYANMLANGVIFTAGGAGVIAENEYLYDAINNPFGSVDLTQVVLEDVPEDDEAYEAIRFVFENGLMAAAGENVFGKDDKATAADLVLALYAMGLGQPGDAVSAAAELAEYGIVAEDIDVNAALTGEAAKAGFSGLSAAFGLDKTYGVPEELPEEMTRGDLAVAVMNYYAKLMEAFA